MTTASLKVKDEMKCGTNVVRINLHLTSHLTCIPIFGSLNQNHNERKFYGVELWEVSLAKS